MPIDYRYDVSAHGDGGIIGLTNHPSKPERIDRHHAASGQEFYSEDRTSP